MNRECLMILTMGYPSLRHQKNAKMETRGLVGRWPYAQSRRALLGEDNGFTARGNAGERRNVGLDPASALPHRGTLRLSRSRTEKEESGFTDHFRVGIDRLWSFQGVAWARTASRRLSCGLHLSIRSLWPPFTEDLLSLGSSAQINRDIIRTHPTTQPSYLVRPLPNFTMYEGLLIGTLDLRSPKHNYVLV
jgi:hypothetical protein